MKIDVTKISYKQLTPDYIPELLEIQEETFAHATGSSDFLRRNTTETLSVCFPAPSLVLGAYYEGRMIAFGILHAAGTTSENLAKDISVEIVLRCSAQRQISKAFKMLGLHEGEMNLCAVLINCDDYSSELLSLFSLDEGVLDSDFDNLKKVYRINDNKPIGTILVLAFLFLVIFITGFMFKYTNHEFEHENVVGIKAIEVISYNEKLNVMDIAIEPDSLQKKCLLTDGDSYHEEGFQILSNDKCYVSLEINDALVFFKDENDLVSDSLNVNNFVVDLKEKDIYYVPLNVEYKLGENKLVVGNPEIKWVSYDGILEITDNVFKGIKVGRTTIKAMVNNQVIKEIQVVVTNTIVEMPKEFNSKKMFLGCEQFTYDEAKLLDEILEYRIKEAGYGTRAGAVAAARFLTLEFPYRISYYCFLHFDSIYS